MATSPGSTISPYGVSYGNNFTVSEDNTTLGLNNTSEYYTLTSATHFLKHYYIWIVFAFGFPGNIFCVLVIFRMSRRHLRTTLFYVAFLAAIDTLAILMKLTKNQMLYKKLWFNETGCQFISMFGLSIPAYANWILIVIAAERFTAVRFPLTVSLIWSIRKAITILVIVFIVIALIHVHIFFTITHDNHYTCKFKEEHDYFRPKWYYIGASVYAIIPAIVLFVLNILIIWFLKKSGLQRRNLLSAGDAAVAEAQRQERQITIMLVTVAVVFVVLTVPNCIYLLFFDDWKPRDVLGKARKTFLLQLTTSLADTNHAVNFYMYFASGKIFRQYILAFIVCELKKYTEVRVSYKKRPHLKVTGTESSS